MCKMSDEAYLDKVSNLECDCEATGDICVSCSARIAINDIALRRRDARNEIEKRVATLKKKLQEINEL